MRAGGHVGGGVELEGLVDGGSKGRVVWKRAGGEVSRRVAYTGGVENGHRLPTATPGSAADETRENDGGAELDVVEAIQHS